MVRLLSQRQQLFHFCPQARLKLQQPPIANRVALGSIRMNFAPSHTDMAQVQIAHLFCNQQDLGEHGLDLSQKGLAKGGQRVMIRVQPTRYEAQRNVRVSRRLQLTRAKRAGCIAVQQHSQHHSRSIRRTAHRRIARIKDAQIQHCNHLNNETRQVVSGENVVNEQGLLSRAFIINGFEFARQHQPPVSNMAHLLRHLNYTVIHARTETFAFSPTSC